MSYTEYNLYEHNSPRTAKNISPTDVLGVTYSLHEDNYYVLSVLCIFIQLH